MLPLPVCTDVNKGKFCSRFGPVSESVLSLTVTKFPPRSIPRKPFEKIELPRIALPVPAKTLTPIPTLKAILLAAPLCVPPIVLFDESTIRIPSTRFGSGPVPGPFKPMRLP